MIKKIIILMILALFMVITAFSEETLRKEFSVGRGKCLDVNLGVGSSINIAGWEKEKVAVTVHFNKTKPDLWDIGFTEGAGGIQITANYKGGGHKYSPGPGFEIRVPIPFDLKLKTLGGDMEIRDVSGEISGKTMGGALELVNLKGTVDLKTMGGDIALRDSEVDGKLKTMGGRVLFENVTGDVNGSSMGGSVIYNNVKSGKGAGPAGKRGKAVMVSTMGGDINIGDAPDGVDVDTMGGNIHIKSAGNYVKARTLGGNIVVDSIDGGMNAVTRGGDIVAVMTGDPQKGEREVNLSSTGGDITLSVPGGLSMDIDIQLAYTKDAQKEYNIAGDFQFKLGKTSTWEVSNGTARKYIYARGQIAGGKHKIRIATVNGNIYLKKVN